MSTSPKEYFSNSHSMNNKFQIKLEEIILFDDNFPPWPALRPVETRLQNPIPIDTTPIIRVSSTSSHDPSNRNAITEYLKSPEEIIRIQKKKDKKKQKFKENRFCIKAILTGPRPPITSMLSASVFTIGIASQKTILSPISHYSWNSKTTSMPT
ncbi:hypothetical protein C1645_840049 [Glomus cerebriforme]|uniref:Uncharacterized protein n=1 Tax=Glomus cerebriforme TaxID=658196 RepID=A0A397S2L6_9GLOM|nr:hypothetical protein C1645_840049 [Glomus cerebriforme]